MKPLICFLILGLSFLSCGSEEEPVEEVVTSFAYTGKWLGNWSDSLFPAISC